MYTQGLISPLEINSAKKSIGIQILLNGILLLAGYANVEDKKGVG